jgi:TonB-linked SusC/RagA family outer membrane protein
MKKNDPKQRHRRCPVLSKMLNIMKVTTLLFFLTLMQVSAISFSQNRINLKFDKERLESVFNKIEANSEYSIFYKNDLIRDSKEVTGEYRDALVFDVLDQVLKYENLSYTVKGKLIMIVPRDAENGEHSNQQQKTVSGKVTDSSGGGLPGVSVVIKGTTIGTITDMDGKYSLPKVPENVTLQFSFVGMRSQDVTVGGKTTINVTLVEESIGIEEVVAVGYGTVKKSDLTGSVASVKSDEIKAFASSNVMQSLSGRAPGVQVSQNTGAPGASVSVRIRGTNSIQGSNEPLYVIDGFPFSGSNPTVLSNNDIESIEILKDASATAIYGSRGANGVILITTKRGKVGKTQVDFESSYGFQSLRKKLEMMDATEYAKFYNEQATNDKIAPYFTQDQINSFGKGYNWQDLVFQTAPIINNSLTVSGGTDKTKFSVSGTVFDQQGIITGSNYKKYSLRAYFTTEINKMLSLEYGATLTKNTTSRQNSSGGNRGGSLIGGAICAPPTLTPYNDNGTYRVLSTAYPFISNVIINPLNFMNEQIDKGESNVILANASLIFEPVKDLKLKIYGGVENTDYRSDYYQSTMFVNSQGVASVSMTNNISLLNENTLSYNKTIAEKHNIGAVVGFTYQDFLNRSLGGSGNGFLSDVTETYDLGSASTPGIPSSGYSKSVLMSYLGRVNYSFDNKYLLTLSLRADGSSKYSEGSKWGYFPSGAFAWKVKEENFLKDNDLISDLKFRSSYGYTGSQAISAYATLNQLTSGKTIFGDALYNAIAPGTTLPGDLKWETTEQADLGFDIAILNNRFRLSADAYLKNTRDLLNTVKLPSSLGFTQTIQNVGQIRNKGFEFSVDAKLLTGQFRWDVNANIALNRSKVIKLYGGQDILSGYVSTSFIEDNPCLLREGLPMGVFYGYKKDGYDANGREIYKDLSGPAGTPDGIINQYDKTIIGDPNPDFIYGLNSTMSYKNFELTMFFQGSYGNDIVNVSSIGNTLDYGFGLNMVKEVFYNHWTPENTNAKYPVISRNASMRYSDRLVEDGSFLRLRNIQLSYNVPTAKLGMGWLRNFQVYASGQNLLTFTKYSWWDPEVNSQGGSNSTAQGIDHYSYPTAKTVTLGVKVGF